MVGRAGLNLVVAAYFHGVSERAQAARGISVAFVGLTAVDGATALALRRTGT
jgi:hypothetical protein